MKCTQCAKEWKQMEDIHLSCCPRCTKLHQALRALIEAKGETILGTLQFQGFIGDLAPRTETHYKSILRQALADNLDKKLWEIVKEKGTGLEIDSLKHSFKTINGYTDASDYVVDSFLYAFGRISENEIGVQQAKKSSKTIKQGHHQSHHKYEEYEDKNIGLVHILQGHSERVHILQGHSERVSSVCYSPDGQYILSGADIFFGDIFLGIGSKDNTIKVWDSRTGALLHTLQGHSESVRSVSYSPDGKYILSGSGDKTIKVWDSRRGALLHAIKGHSERVWSVCYSPDGKYIVSGSEDKTIKVWDIGLMLGW